MDNEESQEERDQLTVELFERENLLTRDGTVMIGRAIDNGRIKPVGAARKKLLEKIGQALDQENLSARKLSSLGRLLVSIERADLERGRYAVDTAKAMKEIRGDPEGDGEVTGLSVEELEAEFEKEEQKEKETDSK